MITRSALAAGTVIMIVMSALWAYSTTLTSAGPVAVPHLTRDPLHDYGQLAGTVTGNVPALFAVTAAIFAVCFIVAGYRRRSM